MRDKFPLPGPSELTRWFELWDDDRSAYEATLDRILGPDPAEFRYTHNEDYVKWCVGRLRSFFESEDEHRFDKFFRSIEVRFILRVFLPCIAKTFRRPSTVLRDIASGNNGELLETAAAIDPTVIRHKALDGLFSGGDSA